jgi:HSP20 family protein
VTNLGGEVDQLFDYAFGRLLGSNDFYRSGVSLTDGWAPAVDLYEDKDSVTVQAELPGLKKEDIHINLQDGVLVIEGERKLEEKQEGTESHRSERFAGRFRRTISLASEVDAEKINATYTDGILTVTLPKSEKAKPRQIPISVK